MVLDPHRLLSLWQDVQEIIIWKEKESWEFKLLWVQVLIETFCDFVEGLITADKVFKSFILISTV